MQQEEPNKRVLYIDPSLRYTLGHHYNVAKALGQALREQGHAVQFLVSRRANKTVAGRRVFRYNVYKDMKLDPSNAYGSRMLEERALRHAADSVQSIAMFKPDIIYAHSVGAAICEGLLLAVSAIYGNRPRPQLVAELPFPIEENNGLFFASQLRSMHKRLHRQSLSALQGFHPLTVCAETSRRLSEAVEFNVGTMPSPYSTTEEIGTADLNNRSLKIGCLGHQGFDKGIHLLPEIANSLAAVARPVELIVQVQPETDHTIVAKLKSTAIQNQPVRLVENDLSDTAYLKLLSELDIVLLPYNPVRYRSAISGICYEALAQGSVIVAPEDSTIGAIIKEYQPSACLFDEWSARSIFIALAKAITHIETLEEEAARGAVSYRTNNGTDAYAKKLIELARPVDKSRNLSSLPAIAGKRIAWFVKSHIIREQVKLANLISSY